MMSVVASGATVACGSGAVVARLLAKEQVAGSTPVFRSLFLWPGAGVNSEQGRNRRITQWSANQGDVAKW